MENKEKVLQVKDLRISFKTDSGKVQAVRGVSFDLYKGETLCIVGESGSGKSVTSKAIMGILSNNAIVEDGSIIYEGEDLIKVSESEYHRLRGHKIGMIFQDPLSSLNPIMKIGKQITESMLINSDKMKLKYNDLISKELTALKNAKVIRSSALIQASADLEYRTTTLSSDIVPLAKRIKEIQAQLKNKQVENKEELEKEMTSLKAQVEEIYQKIKPELDQAKENYVQNAKKINEDYKKSLPVLKANLKKRKKEAKQEISALKKSIIDQRNARLVEAKQKYQGNKAELKKQVALIDEEFNNQIKLSKSEAKKRALEVMKEVGIPQPEKRFYQYPFQFSGGMRQRIVIAIALTADPDILICDEPTTALDVTIQAQILELINKLKAERQLSCIFITHDLGVVANMADRVAVMYAGKICEYGKDTEIFFNPQHPYTWALLSSIPDIDSKEKLEAIPGTPPDMIYPPVGDAFALRNKYAMNIDFKYQPPFFKVSETHYAATWLLADGAKKVELPKIVQARIKVALEEEEQYVNKR